MSEIGAIGQGMQSAGVNRYTARLDAFTKNAKEFQAYDFSKGFESEEAKKQKDAATFTEVALGFKAVPNSNTLYNKHHALLSAKYDALFLDSNITAMAATPEGRAAFSRAVEQLNQETKGYENIYSDTFGDPSTADGKGFTYSDYKKRKSSGGNKDFFRSSGFDISKEDEDYETQLRDLDNNTDIGSISFDPATGTWSGYNAKDPLLSMDMEIAAQYFSYDLRQTSFNSPSFYAQEKPLYDMFKDQNEDAVRQNLTSRRNMMQMEAVAYYQSILGEGDPKKDLTPQQYRGDLVSSNMLETAHKAFEDSIVEGLKERKNKEEEEAKEKKGARNSGGSSGGGGSEFKPIPSTIIDGVAQLQGLKAVTLGSGEKLYPRGIKLSGEDLVLIYEDSEDEIKELKIDPEWEENWLEAIFGQGAAAKIKTKLGATTTDPATGSQAPNGNAR